MDAEQTQYARMPGPVQGTAFLDVWRSIANTSGVLDGVWQRIEIELGLLFRGDLHDLGESQVLK